MLLEGGSVGFPLGRYTSFGLTHPSSTEEIKMNDELWERVRRLIEFRDDAKLRLDPEQVAACDRALEQTRQYLERRGYPTWQVRFSAGLRSGTSVGS